MNMAEQLEKVRGDAPERRPNVRVLAAAAAHGDCNFARLALATGTNLDKLSDNTYFAVEFGQDPQAFQRGHMFEKWVKEKDYAALIQLLREKAGFPITDVRIRDLHKGAALNKDGMAQRAAETRQVLRKIVQNSKDAPNIVDGAVLTCRIAGQVAYFEADGLAAATGGQINVTEVKSFAYTDQQCDPKNLGAACDQAAWYALLVRRTLIDEKLPPEAVSDRAFIILPEGVSLTPTLLRVDIAAKIRRAAELLASTPGAEQMVALAGGMQFPSLSDKSDERIGKLELMMDKVGTFYRPECLQDCGMARLCRARAQDVGVPTMCGTSIVRVLPGIRTLSRAAELASGAKAAPIELHAADALKRAASVYQRVLTTGAL